MSGHSGFQSIGNHLPPPVLPPAVGGAGAPQNVEPIEEAQPGAPGAQPQEPQDPSQEPAARSLVWRLDNLLIRAAALSTRSADAATVKAAAAKIPLGKADRAALDAATAKARQTLSTLAKFTGRQIAAAMTVGTDGVFDWANNAAAKAVRDAIDAQADLSELLHGLANRPDVDGERFESISELALQCDRRQSEIATLAMQLADTAAQGGDDPEVAARLKATVNTLLPRQALSMHGNEAAIEKLRTALQPLADRLDDFASRPNASISNAEFMGYAVELADAAAALERAARDGFPTENGGRVMPDRAFLNAALKFVSFARARLENAREKIGMVSVESFATNTLGIPEDFAVLDPRNFDALESSCPNLAKAARLRYELGEVARDYAKGQSQESLKRLSDIGVRLSKLDDDAVCSEIARLRKTLDTGKPGDMTKKDWDAFETSFKCVSATYTQIAHFVQMVRSVAQNLSPEKFLSTSSARALVEGRLPFSTLVEARVHGMSDADVDPQLDDSRMVSTRPLGSGGANTVHLVTYEDGRECVFKPESAGRMGMAPLSLSKDYVAIQQVAQLNLATQTAARTLGLAGLVPKCSVGSHDGQYGLFMDRAPGLEGKVFAKGKKVPGLLTPDQIKNLSEDKYRLVIGRLMRELNRLQWLDIVTGQGDRHSSNYLVEVRADLSVTVTGIDNDQCYTGYRAGAQTYVLQGHHADRFRSMRGRIIELYPGRHRTAAQTRLETDPGVTELDNGAIRIEPGKFQAQELFWALRKSVGLHSASMPDFIDAELYDSLVALKSGPARDAYFADLSRRIPPAAVASARARLDEAIAHAEKLHGEGRVVATNDFSRVDVQKSLLARDLAVPKNPIKPIGSYRLGTDDIVAEARRQNHSLFGRDLLQVLDRGMWK